MSESHITIIIPTLNAAASLPILLSSLSAQTDKQFNVLVVDGCSTDDTWSIVRGLRHLNLTFSSSPDTGIYDALNRGILMCKTSYYLVVGSDDYLYPDAISRYNKQISSSAPEIITAALNAAGKIVYPASNWSPLKGPFSQITSHSVGCAIRVDLHSKFGLYNEKLSIAADYLFLQRCLDDNIKPIALPFVAGYYSDGGVSSRFPPRTILDQYYALSISKAYRLFLYCWVPLVRLVLFQLKKHVS